MKRKFNELNLYYRQLENTYFELKDSDSWIILEFWRHFQWFLIWFGIPESILGQVYEILLSCEPLEFFSTLFPNFLCTNNN